MQASGIRRLADPSLIRFGLVGLAGIAVNQLALVVGAEGLGLHYLVAAIIATQVSTAFNFLGTDRWVYRGVQGRSSVVRRFLAFAFVNEALLIIRIPALWLLAGALGINYLIANVVTLVVMFAGRFLVADRFLWRGTDARSERAAIMPMRSGSVPETGAGSPTDSVISARATRRHRLFRYDIAGILQVASEIKLRELARFETTEENDPDLVIHRGTVGSWPSRATRFTSEASRLTYVEHLGRAGANFSIAMGSPITISVSGLMAHSPHVVYTNVVEAFLRFLLVSKGYVLLHSACLSAGGRGVLLSAQTDTGKTSTVIRLVRDRGYEFLSDDMTIISADGRAISYPKPMTLSFHTLSAIAGQQLGVKERSQLAIKSRLHSKSGRSVGSKLGERNLPIMSLNSVVQWMVPPPKYHIESLFECGMSRAVPVSQVFLMERGVANEERLDVAGAVPTLIANTDDAYGFPPFATFAPRIVIDGDDYTTLRSKEEAILRRALASAELWRIHVPGHEWAEVLPEKIDAFADRDAGEDASGFDPAPVPMAAEQTFAGARGVEALRV